MPNRTTAWLVTLFLMNSLCVLSQDMDSLINCMSTSSLPIVCVEVDENTLHTDTFTDGRINIITPSGVGGGSFCCKLRIRGNSSTIYDKKSFAVKLYDDKGEDLDTALLGIRPENSWILDAMVNDRLRMRNRLCFDVWNEISKLPYDTKYGGRNGTKGYFVEVYINRKYNGLYCLSDKIDRKLLDLKKAKVKNGEVNVRGLLYKGVKWGAAFTLAMYEDEPVDTTAWNSWELKVPEDYPSIDTWKPLMNLIDFCASNYDYFCHNYRDWFYEENLIDYMAFLFLFNMYDMPWKNTYLSVVDINDGHRFVVTPWDLDASLGMDFTGFYLDDEKFYFKENEKYAYEDKFFGDNGPMPFKALFYNNVNGFKDKVARRLCDLYGSILSPDGLLSRIENYTNTFIQSGAWHREVSRWKHGRFFDINEDISDDVNYAMNWYCDNMNVVLKWATEVTKVESINKEDISIPAFYTLQGIKANNANLRSNRIYLQKKSGKWIKVVKN